MQPVRIAAVRYLNTAPLIEGLEKAAGLTLLPTVPSRIAAMVQCGEADIGLCSIVDAVGGVGAVQGEKSLALLPVGMIGCDGRTMTVRIFSKVPIERITTLHADAESHTSVILARLLLAKRHGVRPELREWNASGTNGCASKDWPEAILLIGDKVVTRHPPDKVYPHQLDLGEEWKAWTGLPFVYAMWMCRAEEAGSARIRTGAALLERQRLHNATRLDWIVETRAPEAGWPLETAREYVGRLLRYEVGAREREAVGRFLKEAAAERLLEAREPIWAG